ncbi:small-conductance mechanosensitive channel [Bernardetia litoralis DSM 6794]|uniref:Mechanosensing system component YbdG n=1 Tax=Bernardetia litoralis (strain ATCC 23117 / DSM 6794 / NBRC 15988 / NCIMB 1366 / Fx l1 / Sio-4) TaxID=880071 RepID=I4AF99_BERLS|nr:mechanosensitive ion channel domain-containing protein [Bernardetia litoralis]AFM02634.1 small-conductance mechanosensitive channel [Bernardetia litoralis DSM 6794]
MPTQEQIIHYFYRLFRDSGMEIMNAKYLNAFIAVCILLVIVFILDRIFVQIFIKIITKISDKTKNQFDNFLVKNNAAGLTAHLLILLFVVKALPFVLWDFPKTYIYIEKATDIFAAFVIVLLVQSVLRTFSDYLKTMPNFRDKPIHSYVQVFMIFAWLAAVVYIFTVLTNKSPWTFFSALGALSAVILLVFRDTILGFVASIQVTVNDMVRIGDWITMDKYNADGDVIEISLATVKVQNFDNTITTIPTYYLISDSFRNWRGMTNAGGRRIKRSILLKVSSIHYLSEEDITELKNIDLIKGYLDTMDSEVNNYNKEHHSNKTLLLNGKNMTNLGVFRIYIEEYLKQNPHINNDMLMMSRQLEATPQGVPLEIYAFSKTKQWLEYEKVVSDIFDHLFAAVPYFNLELFEAPSNVLAIKREKR